MDAGDNAGDAMKAVGVKELLELVHLSDVTYVNLVFVVYRCVKVGGKD